MRLLANRILRGTSFASVATHQAAARLYASFRLAGRFCARLLHPFKEMRLVVATKWTYLIVSLAGFVLGSSVLWAEEPAKTAAEEAAKTTEPAASAKPGYFSDDFKPDP